MDATKVSKCTAQHAESGELGSISNDIHTISAGLGTGDVFESSVVRAAVR